MKTLKLKSKVFELIILSLFAILTNMASVKLMAAEYTWTNLSAKLPVDANICDIAWLSNHFSHKIFLAARTSLLQVNDDNTITTIADQGNYVALYQKIDAGFLWVCNGSMLKIYKNSVGLSEVGISLGENVHELWASDTEYKGYAVGDLGISLFDGVWGTVTAKTTPGTGSVSDVWAVDNVINSVYALSANGIVFRSTDGATSWTAVSGATDIRAMYFRNFNQGWAAGSNGCIYKLNTSGNWEQKYAEASEEFCSIAFTTSGSCGVVISKDGKVLFSGDEGETWAQLQNPGTTEITKVIITEDKKIYLIGDKALFVGNPTSANDFNNLPALVQMSTIQIEGDSPLAESYGSSISDDGNYVVFTSRDDKLVASDVYDSNNLFLWDGSRSLITMADTLANGNQADGISHFIQISGDGKWLMMSSSAESLTNGANDNITFPIVEATIGSDVFVKNRENGTISLISAFDQGTGAYIGEDMNSDGSKIVYSGYSALYLYDRFSGSSIPIETFYYGKGIGESSHIFGEAAISGDGSTVVYSTQDYTIVKDPGGGTAASNIVRTVYVYNVGGSSQVLFKSSHAEFGYDFQGVVNFNLNYDGRFFVHRDEKGQIKLWDLKTRTSEIVSKSTSGEQANGNCWATGISGNGRYVVFYSAASNLVPNDTNGYYDVFLHDCKSGKTTMVSTNIAGDPSTERSNAALGSQKLDISADGKYITYESQSDNLVSTPKNSFTRCVYWAMLDLEEDQPASSGELTVSTNSPATNISANSAIVSGNVTSDSGAMVSECGFICGTIVNPSVGDTGVTKVTAGIGAGTFSATIYGLAANTIYHVRAYASIGDKKSYGEDVSFKTLIATGVFEKQNNLDLMVFPNPTSGTIQFYTPNNEPANRIEVFSIQGKQVLFIDHPQDNNLDLSDFPNGIFLVKIQSKSGVYNHKIVKH